jgi:hypothetical protein
MEALRLFEENYFLIHTTPEGDVMLGLVAQTLAETKTISSELKRLMVYEM